MEFFLGIDFNYKQPFFINALIHSVTNYTIYDFCLIGSTVIFAATLFAVVSTIFGNPPTPEPMRVLYQWKDICYDYLTKEQESYDLEHGIFISGKPFIVDVDVYYPPRK